MIREIGPALCGALLAGLVACGGGELSRTDFVSAVGGTCENANQRLDGIPTPSPAPDGTPGPEALAAYLDQALEINREAAQVIRTLSIPEAFRPERDRLVGAMDEANEGLADAARAAGVQDDEAMARALARMAAGRNDFESAARALGVTRCVNSGLPSQG